MQKKINANYLKLINDTDIKNKFGNWINNTELLSEQFVNAEPFEHIIIPNFLSDEYVEQICNEFPSDYENWHEYANPIEVKYACDNINKLSKSVKDYFYLLSSNEMINAVSKISGIKNLDYDEYLNGAGLHAHPRNGRLNVHLDYEKHPITGKQRRLNIILYMNKTWDESWNGQSELWDKEMKNCVAKYPVQFNTAIIFKTNEISWHGVPEKIKCPEGTYRQSMAYYYVSDLNNEHIKNKFGDDGSGYRTKASFVKRPNDPYDERMEELYKIRPSRRIEQNDMDKIWSDWNKENN